ncbi:MAG: hypothetical protein K0R54_223 [Clostridiaceae bacterium]|jgi:hypothetical protein|nr:hypothetical protein [Clostridiaceae bacterium]
MFNQKVLQEIISIHEVTEELVENWVVQFYGEHGDLRKLLKSKEECIEFIKSKKARIEELRQIGKASHKRHKIIYEEPIPVVKSVMCKIGDYLINNRVIVKKEELEEYILQSQFRSYCV